MELKRIEPPRVFRVGPRQEIELKECARITLDADEQVTFQTASGGQYDVVRKSWGFYATPSLNKRLAGFGLRAAIVKNPAEAFFIMLVERDKQAMFQDYLQDNGLTLVHWMDSDQALRILAQALQRGTV